MESQNSFWDRIKKVHHRLNGSTICYDLDRYKVTVDKIHKKQSLYKIKSDNELKCISQQLIQLSQANCNCENLRVDAFSLVKETISRVLHQITFDEQLIGGLVLTEGKIAEMQTGEGKTMTALFPAFYKALSGKGVHLLTFNDYLASRDSQWMGPVFTFLGLSVGLVHQGMSIKERQKSYSADVTYLTAKESGFDYLRDHNCYQSHDIVQRKLNFAIIDEADSILIDEARIPLVIAGPADQRSFDASKVCEAVKKLCPVTDYEFNQHKQAAILTENGIQSIEQELHCGNLYESINCELLESVQWALQAHFVLKKDKNYLVRNNQVEIIDEFTGRIADKRRWPDGLHEAVEIKENCPVKPCGKILNSITLQHYLQKYPEISGMTATAQTAEDEFREFYNIHIVVIPPHGKCIRLDHKDLLFLTKQEKFDAIVKEIIEVQNTGRPILVGTQSVKESKLLSDMLKSKGIRCEILNAQNDSMEAQIISVAGQLGAVTISTNMAGRGTDIRLGGPQEKNIEKIKDLGGLYVIGTNRGESQRIDNQLRGRAGRQGDPGTSRFFISIEDDLFIKFNLNELLDSPLEKMIETKEIRIEIDRIQRIIENHNLDAKKTLFEYSELIEQQREIICDLRDQLLLTESKATDFFSMHCEKAFQKLECSTTGNHLVQICRIIFLNCIDQAWSDYLCEIRAIKESIHLRKIGGQDPLFEFRKICIPQFELLLKDIENLATDYFNNINFVNGNIDLNNKVLQVPSSTWTYLINDVQLDHSNGLQFLLNSGTNAWAGLLWPLTAILFLFKKIKLDKGRR